LDISYNNLIGNILNINIYIENIADKIIVTDIQAL
jgi:hypothetical protein